MFSNLYKASPIFSFLMVGSFSTALLVRKIYPHLSNDLLIVSAVFLGFSLVAVLYDVGRSESTPDSVIRNYLLGVTPGINAVLRLTKSIRRSK